MTWLALGSRTRDEHPQVVVPRPRCCDTLRHGQEDISLLRDVRFYNILPLSPAEGITHAARLREGLGPHQQAAQALMCGATTTTKALPVAAGELSSP